MPVDKILMPFTFCDFVLKNVFPSEYKTIKSKQSYSSIFNNSKAQSVAVKPFFEPNIFNSHL